MNLSFYPMSKNKLNIPANSFADLEFLTPGDRQFYLKSLYCNRDDIACELKDDANSYSQEPINLNFFKDETQPDLKVIFGSGTRLRVRLHNLTEQEVKSISFSLIGYKIHAE